MAETKTKKVELEREYTIPLREKCRTVPRYRKSQKAVKVIKEFLARHMKVRDRDLDKIKLDRYLNEYVWSQGIRNPPHKIKVKVRMEGNLVRAELAEMPTNLKFKKEREERRETKSTEKKTKKAKKEAPKENKETPEEKAIEEEKKTAVVEEGIKEAKEEYLKEKHTTKTKSQREEKSMQKGYNKTSRGK